MTALEMLHFALDSHGIDSYVENGCVLLAGDSGLILEPRVFEGPPNDNAQLIQLDIAAHTPRIAPRVIVDSMAGTGTDRAAAERDAFGKFLLGSFHVLLTALADHSCESNPAQWLKWSRGHETWRVCEGPLLVHATGSKSTTYPGFFQQLEALFLASVPHDAHWVSVFLASFGGKLAGADVLLDNEPWAEATALVNQWDWKFPDEYRSLRHFFVALPDPL
jgi:hypothetical protein